MYFFVRMFADPSSPREHRWSFICFLMYPHCLPMGLAHWIPINRKVFWGFLYWLRQSLWLCGSQQTMENSFKRWEYQTYWEICMQVKKQQLELDMEQQTGSKLGKKYIKAVYCHTAYLTYMQSTSCEMPGWMKQKLESRLPGETSITSDMQMTPPLWQKAKRN